MFRCGISRHVPRMLNISFVGRFSPQVPTFSTQAERPAPEMSGAKDNAIEPTFDVTRFMRVLRFSNMTELHPWLTNGIPVDVASSALHEVRRVDILHKLLDAKADINFVSSKRISPLMTALEDGRTQVAEAMIAAKADVNFTTADGQCPLTFAVVNCPDFAETLLEAGAVIPTAPIGTHRMPFLHLAIRSNLHSLVETMLPSADLTAVDAMGNNFVAAAAHSADTNMMSLVLKYATVDQVNAVNNKNYSVLDIAASHNTPAVVRLLRGANAEITSTIFIKSVTHTKATTVLNVMLPLLLEAGADIDARGNKGDTALHVAAFYGRTDVVDTLISLKADVNSLNDRGLTPLVTAVSRRYTTTAQPLLDAGATVPKSPGVMSEFNRLVCLGESYPVDILLNAKADVNGKDSKGFTPLRSCLMARNFHSHMLEKLVAAGADTVTYRELLLEVCIKHKVDPAVIGIVVGKEKADSKAGKKESSAEVAPEEATTA